MVSGGRVQSEERGRYFPGSKKTGRASSGISVVWAGLAGERNISEIPERRGAGNPTEYTAVSLWRKENGLDKVVTIVK